MAKTTTCGHGPHMAKGLCEKCYDKARYTANPDPVKARARKWAAANKEKTRSRMAKYSAGAGGVATQERKWAKKYGLTVEQLREVRGAGVCWLCGSACDGNGAAVDHNHETGKVRGLLCKGCNSMLGRIETVPKGLGLTTWGFFQKVSQYLGEA